MQTNSRESMRAAHRHLSYDAKVVGRRGARHRYRHNTWKKFRKTSYKGGC